ncbi:MAG: cupin domain-containing protein [Candidatus Aminicenantes bacterium]
MIIKNNNEVDDDVVQEDGVNNVTRQILIGPEDGSSNIIMRRFCVRPRGHTPYHVHAHEHVVNVTKGRGIVIDQEGKENYVQAGQSLLIRGEEKHQFKNPYDDPFEFLCIILNPEKTN